jgi:hypothetical protein
VYSGTAYTLPVFLQQKGAKKIDMKKMVFGWTEIYIHVCVMNKQFNCFSTVYLKIKTREENGHFKQFIPNKTSPHSLCMAPAMDIMKQGFKTPEHKFVISMSTYCF